MFGLVSSFNFVIYTVSVVYCNILYDRYVVVKMFSYCTKCSKIFTIGIECNHNTQKDKQINSFIINFLS